MNSLDLGSVPFSANPPVEWVDFDEFLRFFDGHVIDRYLTPSETPIVPPTPPAVIRKLRGFLADFGGKSKSADIRGV